jgi:predicted nucleic acid-binding protein
MTRLRVVLDTNVFVAASFRRSSASARLIERVRAGELDLVWNDRTRGETERVIRRIPRLSWQRFDGLFRAEHRMTESVPDDRFASIPDRSDRKFAALAATADAILVSSDEDLLGHPRPAGLIVCTPGQMLDRMCPDPAP